MINHSVTRETLVKLGRNRQKESVSQRLKSGADGCFLTDS